MKGNGITLKNKRKVQVMFIRGNVALLSWADFYCKVLGQSIQFSLVEYCKQLL